MTYRTILADLTAEGPADARLGVARSLALRFEATLVGLHVTPPLLNLATWHDGTSFYVPAQVAEAQGEAQRKANEEVRDRVRTAFERVCGADPRATWREVEGYPGWALAEAAHASDLVVAAKGGALEIVEQVVTAAGVPVLMLPPDAPSDLGRVVLVAWKGSREATRAVHDALPFLRAAERVVLCAVGEGTAADLDDAVTMLERHGVPVHPERVGGTDAGAGEVLLARAAAHGADLLVMGAYGHSRLREMVLGGATRHVLRHATLPVLLSG